VYPQPILPSSSKLGTVTRNSLSVNLSLRMLLY
jgi:hypothetical protein